MKSLFLVFLLIAGACHLNAQPLHKEDKQTILIRFNNLNVIITSNRTIDPALQAPKRYMQFPFPPKGFNLFVFAARILVTEEKDPFVNGFQPSHIIIDTSAADALLTKIDDVETDISWHNQPLPWISKGIKENKLVTNPRHYPFSDDSIFRPGTYYELHLMAGPDNAAGVNIFRNRRTKQELFRINAYENRRPIIPALGTWIQDSSSKQKNLSIDKWMTSLYDFSWDKYEALEQEDPGIRMNNEKVREGVLALYFIQASARYRDSSLEYKLQRGAVPDSQWHTTGHRLVLSQLLPGENYRLVVRYKIHPTYMQEYRFYAEKRWYQTTMFTILVICTCACIGLAMIIIGYRRRERTAKKKKERLSLEIKAIRSQLNPHFIFNALNSIQSLVNKNNMAGANRYLSEFSSLLRESLLNSDKEMTPLSTELKTLETYIHLEQLRFQFHYAIIVDPAINQHATELPTLLLQPIVENAIKHGISVLGENGNVTIQIKRQQENMIVSIADNGPGFTEKKEGNGFGLKLTRQRIDLINSNAEDRRISLQMETRPNAGTTVHLTFKNWL